MAGHNKWSKIKNSKGALDQKRGKLFTKLGKELMVAARLGGGNSDTNARLRQAITAAKQASMPRENIERAIQKGAGELQSDTIEEMTYEGYGPSGFAILVEATSDNRNRTVSDLRNLFKSGGGNLGETGSVAWMFTHYGQLIFEAGTADLDRVMDLAIEAGAQDVIEEQVAIEIRTDPTDVYRIKEAFEQAGMPPTTLGFTFIPKTSLSISDQETALKAVALLEAIEDHDDVQRVHANVELPAELSG